MYNKGLFHDWVPKPVMLLLIIVFILPVLCVNGVYTNNNSFLTGSLGGLSEHMQMAIYASTIGMMVVFPLVVRIKQYLPSKITVISSLVMLSILSLICGSTDSPEIIIICSFAIGFFKMFAMMEFMLPVMFLLSPTGNRGRFYSVFYPITIAAGQLSGYYATVIADQLQWQNAYYFMAIVLLICALIAVIFMHNLRSGRKVPLYYFDWLSMVMITSALMLLNYVLVFFRQQDGFNSPYIFPALAAAIAMLILFALRQENLKRPYLSLKVLSKKNVRHGLVMMVLTGLYMSTSSIQSLLTTNVLHYSNLTNASMNLWMIPGILAGGVAGFFWFKNKWWLKTFLLSGFFAFQLYAIYMYLLMAPVIELDYLIFPTILRGYAMTALFVGIGFYLVDKLPFGQMLSASAILIMFRSFFGIAIFGSILSWAIYQLQWQHLSDLATNMIAVPSSSMQQYPALQKQALLTALKELFGYVILCGWFIMLYVASQRFKNINYRRRVLFRKLVSLKPIRGYRINANDMSSAAI